jgi:hypothetical protein
MSYLSTNAASRLRSIIPALFIFFLTGPGIAWAQTSPASGMGATSPLGSSPSDTSPAGSSAIPLGATELNVPGLSPMVSCPDASANSAFDGGGVGVSSPSCSSQATATASQTASNPTTPGLAVAGGSGSSIPLGATSLAMPGESQQVNVPSSTLAPCSVSPTSASDASGNANMSISASGC